MFVLRSLPAGELHKLYVSDDGQSVKSKRKKNIMPTNKLLVSVYNRIVELMDLIPGLLTVQTLPDTLVLQVRLRLTEK